MILSRPKLPKILENSTLATMVDDGELEDVQLRDVDGTNISIAALDLSGVLLDKVVFLGAHFGRVTMCDVSIQASDLSSAHLSNGAVVRAEFVNCRLTGVDFSQTSLHDVVFKGCKLDYANFRQTDLRRVNFVDCTLQETDFGSAKLSSVEFQSSQLERTVFHNATCSKVDLTSSQLLDIVGLSSMKGAIIDTLQLVTIAPHLAHAVGIIVK